MGKGQQRSSQGGAFPIRYTCPECSEAHYAFSCPKFQEKTLAQRELFVNHQSLCFKCLKPGHGVGECYNRNVCRICEGRHHVMLHPVEGVVTPPIAVGTINTIHSQGSQHSFTRKKLMQTCELEAAGPTGRKLKLRAFIDEGADSSSITARAAQILQLEPLKQSVEVSAFGDAQQQCCQIANFSISSYVKRDWRLPVSALIVKKIMGPQPRQEASQIRRLVESQGLKPADPNFDRPGEIDVLLGADVIPFIQSREGATDSVVARDTVFGHVFLGTYGSLPDSIPVVSNVQMVGTRVSDFQATDEFGEDSPEAVSRLTKSFDVDELLGGADTVAEVVRLRQELLRIIAKGGFTLRKLRSSHKDVVREIPQDLVEPLTQKDLVDSYVGKHPKALGLKWNRWDPPLPDPLRIKPQLWREELSQLVDLELPRCYVSNEPSKEVSLHGILDASEKAYGAVIYIRAIHENHPPTVNLVVAKSRVLPLREKRTLPELELMGAVLLADLLQTVQQTLELEVNQVWAWSDSTTVLSWVKAVPTRYKVFVASRITTATEYFSPSIWSHVLTLEDPADLASRGVAAGELKRSKLWWNGPSWLSEEPIARPRQPQEAEMEAGSSVGIKASCSAIGVAAPPPSEWVEARFRSYHKVFRLPAWIMRAGLNFGANGQEKNTAAASSVAEVNKAEQFLQNTAAASSVAEVEKAEQFLQNTAAASSVAEVEKAEQLLLKRSQGRTFAAELKALSQSPPHVISKSSNLLSPHPYLGRDGLLHSGGRLSQADILFIQNHLILLSMCHCGPTLLMSTAGKRFYCTGARLLAKLGTLYLLLGTLYLLLGTLYLLLGTEYLPPEIPRLLNISDFKVKTTTLRRPVTRLALLIPKKKVMSNSEDGTPHGGEDVRATA